MSAASPRADPETSGLEHNVRQRAASPPAALQCRQTNGPPWTKTSAARSPTTSSRLADACSHRGRGDTRFHVATLCLSCTDGLFRSVLVKGEEVDRLAARHLPLVRCGDEWLIAFPCAVRTCQWQVRPANLLMDLFELCALRRGVDRKHG